MSLLCAADDNLCERYSFFMLKLQPVCISCKIHKRKTRASPQAPENNMVVQIVGLQGRLAHCACHCVGKVWLLDSFLGQRKSAHEILVILKGRTSAEFLSD